MPSGVVVPNGIIISVNFNTQKCEVYWQNPIMACIVDFKDLLPPFQSDRAVKQYVIYKHPKDFPHHYVVRVWNITYSGRVIPVQGYLAENLEDAREFIPKELARLERHQEDDPCVVELWI